MKDKQTKTNEKGMLQSVYKGVKDKFVASFSAIFVGAVISAFIMGGNYFRDSITIISRVDALEVQQQEMNITIKAIEEEAGNISNHLSSIDTELTTHRDTSNRIESKLDDLYLKLVR